MFIRFAPQHRHVLLSPVDDDPGEGGEGDEGEKKSPSKKDPPAKKDPPPAVESITLPKDQFDQRISKAQESATRKMLKELGYESADELKTVLKTAKALSDEKKTELEKLQARITELEPHETKAKNLVKRFEKIVGAEFDKLPEAVREAIDEVADGDSEKRWTQIEVLRKSGLLGSQTDAGDGDAKKKPPGAPKTIAPGKTPPASESQKTKFEEWQELRATNRTLASFFFKANASEIDATRPKATTDASP